VLACTLIALLPELGQISRTQVAALVSGGQGPSNPRGEVGRFLYRHAEGDSPSFTECFEDAARTARRRQKTSSSRICGRLYRFRLPWRKPQWL